MSFDNTKNVAHRVAYRYAPSLRGVGREVGREARYTPRYIPHGAKYGDEIYPTFKKERRPASAGPFNKFLETFHTDIEHVTRGRSGYKLVDTDPSLPDAQFTKLALATRLSKPHFEAFDPRGANEVWQCVEYMRELLWPGGRTSVLPTQHVAKWLRNHGMDAKLAGTKWMQARLDLLRKYEAYQPDQVFVDLKLARKKASEKASAHPGNPANQKKV